MLADIHSRLPSYHVVPVLLLTALAPAQSLWQQLTPPTSPPARTDAAIAIDPTSGNALLFGGADSRGWLGDTWTWDGASWLQRPTFAAPPGRRMHAMADDPARQRIVLFGGCNAAGDLGDTWEWDGSAWTHAAPSVSPSPRRGHAMAFDAGFQLATLFGGNDGTYRDDTWDWDGSRWTLQYPTRVPPARCGHAMVYDPVRQYVLMFGGENGTPLGDTWVWAGRNWTQLSPPNSPPARSGHGLAYNPTSGTVILFGGFDGSRFLADTWEWDGNTWRPLILPLQPVARQAPAMIGGLANRVFAFGGWNNAELGDTWALQHTGVKAYSLFGTSCGGNLTNTMPPRLGQTFEIRVDNLPQQRLGVVLTGVSDTTWGPLSLPLPLAAAGAPGCTLYVSAEVQVPFNTQFSTSVSFGFGIPNTPALAGASFYNQALTIDPPANQLGLIASNAGVATLIPELPSEIVEAFVDESRFDASRSSGTWLGGAAPGQLGWDGLHGEFDPTLGRSLGSGVFEWNTDLMVIPYTYTLSGVPELVTDGVFRFSKMVVPAGITVRFVGSRPAHLFVRGELRVEGTIDLDGESLPEPNGNSSTGQPGGRGGAFGGSGGDGADASDGTNRPRFSGAVGQDVQVPAGHAYASQTPGTGGQGSSQFPAQNSAVVAGLRGFFSIQVAAGGGGGGFATAGGQGRALQTPNEFGVNQPQFLGPPAAGGQAFNVLPLPSGASVLDHFSVGGSGGGGAGSHPYLSQIITPAWHSGGGGGGGGGSAGARVGRMTLVGPNGVWSARGGSTQASGQNNFGVPGGGGAGGAVTLQCSRPPVQLGLLDVSGGTGGTVTGGFYDMKSKGGDGAPGHVHVEAPGPLPSDPTAWTGVTRPPATQQDIAVLQEQDAVTGNQSLWYPTGAPTPPRWIRYEIDATVAGNAVLYSDDPTVGTLAGPGSPVQFFVQGAQVDPTGQPAPATVTPWRRYVGPFAPATPSLQDDGATGFRFLLLFDRSVAQPIVVHRVRVLLQ